MKLYLTEAKIQAFDVLTAIKPKLRFFSVERCFSFFSFSKPPCLSLKYNKWIRSKFFAER